MSLEGFKPISNDALGSLVSRVKKESVPFERSVVAQNVRYKINGVQTRNGLSKTMNLDAGYEIYRLCGGGVLTQPSTTGQDQIPLVVAASSDNTVYELLKESPAGSGIMVAVQNIGTSAFGNMYADFTFAYNKAFFTVNDFLTGHGLAASTAKRYGGTGVAVPIGLAQQSFSAPVATAAASGIMNAGMRFMMVLFETDSGYQGGNTDITGTAIQVTTDGTQKVNFTNLPIGSPSVVVTKRILCFTTVGAPPEGPYYYIPEDTIVDGVTMTSTVVPNNTATTFSVNFTDQFLQGSQSVSSPVDFFDKIILFPAPCALYFSPTNRRMIACGGYTNRTIFFVSEQDDPETFLGSTGFIDPNQNNGEFAVCAREYKSQLYLFKETAGFLAYNDAANPVDWTVEKRWDRVGPVGPWAVDVNEQFMIILDQSGVYMVDGSIPDCISDEISSSDSDIWAKINWQVKQKFWVFIDNDLNEIHVGVAMDGATEVNVILKCNYLLGLSASKRRWSLDSIASTKMLKMQRTIPTAIDQRIKSSQIIHLSSNYDGGVNLVDPASYLDNGNGYNSVYQTGYHEEEGEMQIGGIGINVSGQGGLKVSILKDQDTETPLNRIINLSDKQQGDVIKCRGTSPWFAVKFSNNGVGGNWFDITRCDLYVRTIFKTRRVRNV